MKATYLPVVIFFMSVALCCCKDENEDPEPVVNYPAVSIGYPANITASSFTVEVNVESDGGASVTDRGICFRSTPFPTINDEKVAEGTGTGVFTVTADGLPSNTLYYILGYATNSKGTIYSTKQYTAVTSFGSVTDFEDNVYSTVKIGSQEWMRENLKSTKYADGSSIPGAHPAGGNEANVAQYGRLYDWYAVMHGEASSDANPSMVQGVCPEGYHVPGDAEWKELEMQVGMSLVDADLEGYRGDVAGTLKVRQLWVPAPGIADNTSGFSALPAGYREINGTYEFDSHFWGAFHISTESADTSTVASRLLTGDYNGIWRYSDSKKYGYSVRCIKDE